MTPHDELMALAGKWLERAQALDAEYDRKDWELAKQWLAGKSEGLDECHSELAALLDSDAFRAMVRDVGRWQHYAASPQTALALGTKLNPNDPDVDWTAECNRLSDAAIDAAASGAGE